MEHPLRLYRRSNGVSLDAMAERLGVSKSQLSRVETGEQDPTMELIRRVIVETGGAVDANSFVRSDAEAAQ